MPNLAEAAAVGFFSAFLGTIIGFWAASLSKKFGRRFQGSVSGFTAGLLIAFVCFEILEEGFAAAPLYVGVAGILSGVAAATVFEGLLPANSGRGGRASLIIATGVMLHHFPEGLALGGMLATGTKEGLLLAMIICIHCIPEAAAVMFPLVKERRALVRTLLYAAALSLPMLAGSVLGLLLTGVSGVFLALSLTFAGGVMLYIACGEMLPGSKELWRGRTTTVCALLGFVLGVIITT